jgi:hypothetical protein
MTASVSHVIEAAVLKSSNGFVICTQSLLHPEGVKFLLFNTRILGCRLGCQEKGRFLISRIPC